MRSYISGTHNLKVKAQMLATTGFRFFAECLRHSAKAKLHSAKPLSSAVLGKEHMAKN